MRKIKSEKALRVLAVAACLASASCGVPSGQPPMQLRYDEPAADWMTSALPLGNGELGCMFFGGIDTERIMFNEKSLWTGSREERGAYQVFGDLYVDFHYGSDEFSGYERKLDIDEAVGTVSFSAGRTHYTREYFVSRPDGVVAVHFAAPGSKGKINLTVRMEDAHGSPCTADGGSVMYFGGKLDLISYAAAAGLSSEGGTVAAGPGSIKVSGADEVTIILAAGTNFDIASADYVGVDEEALGKEIRDRVVKACAMSWKELKARHVDDYRELYGRVTLDLREEMPGYTTDELIAYHRDSRYLDMLYFQYGRYLMISSSRGMALPSNLQGIWNGDNTPPWQCDIHSNINVQMNYWPAEVTNLPECHMPFLEYVATEALRPSGSWRKIASDEGLDGWTVKTQNNIFGYSDWNINRPANAWYCMHLWQHYAYTKDLVFLEETAFPVMKSACEYWFGRLAVDSEGRLVAPDEWSPEQGPWQDGVAYAQQLVWQLFDQTLKASDAIEECGKRVDRDFVDELRVKFSALDNGIEAGDWGQIKEWKQDTWNLDVQGNNHRHISQLIALYPGNQISPFKNEDYARAARVTLESRGDLGTGWSRAWKIACWARLLDGNHAYRLLKAALTPSTYTAISVDNDRGGVYTNLFDSHPPFQIDGNFGASAGMAEMLVQSSDGFINLLPALPDAWPEGRVGGLKAEGNFSLYMEWKNKGLTALEIVSGSGGTCSVFCPDMNLEKISDSRGKNVPFESIGGGIVAFCTEKGGRYSFDLR